MGPEASTWGRWKGVGRTEAGFSGVPRWVSNIWPSTASVSTGQPRPLTRPPPCPAISPFRFLDLGGERTQEPDAAPGSNPDSVTRGAWPPGAGLGNGPTTPSSGRVGARKRRLPARSSPAASSVSLFSLGFFFFHPCPFASFSSRGSAILAKPQPLSNPSRPPGAQGASPLPRPAPRPERRPGPGPPTRGCSRAQPALISR